MGNFSKYFHETVKHKSCSDFFHPGKTCWELRLELVPKLFSGMTKFLLPILLLPATGNFEWSKEFFVKYGKVALQVTLGGVIPVSFGFLGFCTFYPFLKNHYFLFYTAPITVSAVFGGLIFPSSFVNVLALGGANHLLEFIVDASKGTPLYELKSSVMLPTLLFMTLSSTIVYMFKTTRFRPYWLLHVPNKVAEEWENNENCATEPEKTGWLDWIVKQKRKICHHEDSCEVFIMKEVIKVSKIGLIISGIKSLLTGYAEMRQKSLTKLPGIFIKNLELGSLSFLVLYCGSFKLFNCALNRYFGVDSTKNAIMAGYLSGVSYLAYPQFMTVSFAFMRTIQLMWLKYVEDYKGTNKMIGCVKGLPWGFLIFVLSVSTLFANRVTYPHLTSKYVAMCLNYCTGFLSDVFTANYYGVLMGLQ